jgi:hypothetical protein
MAVICTVAIVFAAGASAKAQSGTMKLSRGHVPKVVSQLQPQGILPGTNRLNLAIGVAMRDPKGLDAFIDQVSNPANPNYRQYLTPEQFTDRFGPTEADYAAVVDFARQNNMTVTATHANRLVLDVNAAAADIQRAFQITLRTYRHPTESRDFFAPDVEPTVHAKLPMVDISGLNNYVLPHPKSLESAPASAAGNAIPRNGSASGGAYLGKDFRAAYMSGVSLTGTGQSIGLLEFDGFYSSDISAYESAAGLPNVPVQAVLLDGFSGTPTRGPNSGDTEVSIDIEMAIAMAPGISKVFVFEAGPNGLQNDILSTMAASNQVKQLSCSWGWGGGPSTTTDNIFKQMAAQGQSFFDASGDSDAFTSGQVDDPNQTFAPSSCPFITLVGGTTLTTSGAGGSWLSETVWNAGGGEGSSGGISSYYSIPSWQMGISMSANGGSATHRNIPDVALIADNVYAYYGNGRSGAFVGTSCATPLWAAFTALVNEQAASKGGEPVGFINPAIYAIGKSTSYTSLFHDITTGNNTWSSSLSSFYAVAGYDLCTGWGTPAGQSLIDALTGPPDALAISPGTGFSAEGPLGGPYAPNSIVLSLTNSGTTALNWSLINRVSWLIGSPAQGLLSAGATAQVTVSLAAATENLRIGTYEAGIIFTNWNSHATQSVPFNLQVGQSVVGNGGFESGDLSSWVLVGNTSSSGSGGTLYNGVQSLADDSAVVHSGTYGMFLGDTQMATLSQDIATVPGQAYLLSFWLDNPSTGAGQSFLVNWIDNSVTTNTLYTVSNPPVLPWTNLQFIVVAGSANTILQFGAENPPNAFGLDDINLTPIPSAGFQSVAKTTDSFSMNWRAAAGLSYQLQYKTNLVQQNWINLGAPLVATNSSLTVSDVGATSDSTQRFYRLVLQP